MLSTGVIPTLAADRKWFGFRWCERWLDELFDAIRIQARKHVQLTYMVNSNTQVHLKTDDVLRGLIQRLAEGAAENLAMQAVLSSLLAEIAFLKAGNDREQGRDALADMLASMAGSFAGVASLSRTLGHPIGISEYQTKVFDRISESAEMNMPKSRRSP